MNRSIRSALAWFLFLLAGCVFAQEPAKLRVKVFPGAQNLPLFAGVAKGFFAKRGIAVELLFTVNSTELRDGLANGDIEVAHSAVDNSVAMVELAGRDSIIVSGGDSSMNELFVQGYVTSVADLRGRTVIVDAPNTAYALQVKKILLNAGLKAGDYAVKPVGGGLVRARDAGEPRQRGFDPEPAVHVRGREKRHEEPGTHHRSSGALPGDGRVRDARLGAGQCKRS